MLSEKELERYIDKMMESLDDVNSYFIAKIAKQVKKIGELNQSSVNRYVIMAEMGEDISEINRKLQTAIGITQQQLKALFQLALNDVYTDSRFKQAIQSTPSGVLDSTSQSLVNYTRNVYLQTAGELENLSNTTAVSQTYRDAVDKAILAVTSGVSDYQSATREIIRNIGYSGMQVQYASGYHRRLDTAVRQNVIGGAIQIAQHGADTVGEMLGYDAVEISAHLNSAPDHEDVQGHVLLHSEYEKMQAGQSFRDVSGRVFSGFKRPIAEWNCMHFATPFDTKSSVRRYSDSQLSDWIAQNHSGIEFEGKPMTMYQVTQAMRKTETDIRRWKDTANAARAANDPKEQTHCQLKINALSAKYAALSKASGLPMRLGRTAVEGFRAVRV